MKTYTEIIENQSKKETKLAEEIEVLGQNMLRIETGIAVLQEYVENGKINTSLGKRLVKTIKGDLSAMEFNMLHYWDERGLIPEELQQEFIQMILESDKTNN